MRRVPNHLKEKRERLKLTREAVASLVRVSDRSLARYESGERAAPYPLVVVLALLYSCKVTDLVPDSGNELLETVSGDEQWAQLRVACRGLSREDVEMLVKLAKGLQAKGAAEANDKRKERA